MTSRQRDTCLGRLAGASLPLLLLGYSTTISAQTLTATNHIRVELVRYLGDTASVNVASDSSLELRLPTGKELNWQGDSRSIQITALDGGQLSVTDSGAEASSGNNVTVQGPLSVSSDAPIRIAPQEAGADTSSSWHAYRGDFSVSAPQAGKIRAVDTVALEEYVAAVTGCEIGAGAPAEALKAQCVASRTYALYNLNRLASEGADVDDSTRTQQYGDLNSINSAVLAAVSSTRDQVLTYAGKIIDAVYSTDCGGITAPGPPDEPYLKPVLDPECAAESPWTKTFTTQELEAALSRDSALNVNQLFSIAVKEADESERVVSVLITCQNPTSGIPLSQTVTGSALRRLLGNDVIRSTRFSIAPTSTGFLFTGRGWGHGMGMCQAGAIALANGPASASYKDILAHYYSGCTLSTITSTQPAT